MEKSCFKDRLNAIMKKLGMSIAELSRLSGVHPSTISSYLQGTFNPKQDKVNKIAAALDIDPNFLTGEYISKKQRLGVKIPVLGHVAANPDGEYAVEDVIGWEEIPLNMALTGDHFGLIVKGDSMEPYICEGDIVIVKKQDTANTGEIVIALINGESATCKKIIRSREGISLVSFNPKYEPRTFSNKDIEELPVIILGRVVESREKC